MSGIFINSDAQNFFRCYPIEMMNDTAVRHDVDFYTDGGGVEAVFYNMNFQRCCFPTKVGTPIWKDIDYDEQGRMRLRGQLLEEKYDREFKSWIPRVVAMYENLPDFMQYRYDYCRSKGVEMWHSMRMNDIHYTTLGLEFQPQHSDLWLDRKDLIQGWYRHTWRGTWQDNTFDYGEKEVYDYHLGIAREYLMDYESDGIELDWLRALPVFKPGYDEKNTGILTQFMRDVRAIADEAAEKWGHPIRIAVRVPYFVEEAFGCGMDVPAWCREKLVDIVIPSPQNTSTEQYAQIAVWRLLVPQDVILAACVDYNMGSQPGWYMTFDNDTDCGFAANFYQQGADRIYLYNHYPHMIKDHPDMQEFMAKANDRDWVESHFPRRCVVTMHQPVGEGKFTFRHYPPAIWPECSNGGVKVNAGCKTEGHEAVVIVGATCPLNVDILLNTVKCELLPADAALPRLPEKKGANFVQAKVPANVLHDGWNNIELFNYDQHTILDTEIVWMELMIL